MPAVLLPNGKQAFVTPAGVPAVGYKVATFAAGTNNPQSTWADALKVALNANPVILDARGEASIFWDGTYKVQLQDPTGTPVWTQDNISSLLTAAQVGAALYFQTAAEFAVAVTPTNYTYPPLYVDRYGTNTVPGTTSMVTAITNAIAVAKQMGGGTITFQDGTDYFCGTFSSGGTAFTIASANNLIFMGRARIVTNTTGAGIPNIFYFTDCSQIVFNGLRFYDSGANIQVDWQAPYAIYATTTTSSDCGGFDLRDVECQNLVGPFAASSTGGGTGRVRGIHFSNLKLDACYYGPVFQENGDGVTGNVVCNNCRRNYFVYGVNGHNVTLDIWHDSTTTGSNSGVFIKRYLNDTGGIKIRASYHGFFVKYGSAFHLETQTTAGSAGITALGAITAGSLYTDNWYPNVTLTGGTGTGASATVVSFGGAIVGCWINNRGKGYLVGDSLSASQANLGGTGSGFAVAVSAVGGAITNCELNLDMSDAHDLELIPAQEPTPIAIDSLTPGGALNLTTTDLFDAIAISGNFGAWSFGQFGSDPQVQPILIQSTQTGAPGRLYLGGDLFGNFQSESPYYPGFVVRTDAATDVYTKIGDLTAAPVFIDLSKYGGAARPWSLRISINATSSYADGSRQSNYEYVLNGQKVSGAIPAINTITPVYSSTSGASPAVVTFAASGLGVNVSFTNYNGAQAYLKMAVHNLSRFN